MLVQQKRNINFNEIRMEMKFQLQNQLVLRNLLNFFRLCSCLALYSSINDFFLMMA